MDFRFSRLHGQYPMALPIALPMGLIVVGETLLFNRNLEGCATVHLLNILICVLAPILLKENPILWQSFSLVSILRVLNLGMPRFNELTLLWIPIIYAPAIVVGFMLIRDERLGLRDYLVSLKRFFNISPATAGWKAYYLPLSILIALFVSNIEFKVLGLTNTDLRLIPELNWEYFTLLFVVMVFFVGLGEEVVFRYILQTRLQASVGIIAALSISSLVFALMHSGYSSLPYMAYVFGVSVMLGVIFYRTNSLAFVSLIHGTLNVFLFSLLPYGHLVLF